MLTDILRRQDGILSRAQALAAGITPAQIRHRLRTGRWLRVSVAVYAVAGRERTDRARLFAAVLSAGPEAVAHGAAAAWWHGMTTALPSSIGVTVPRRRRPRSALGPVRHRDLPWSDVVRIRGLRVTGKALSVVEAAVEPGIDGAALMDRALQRHVGLEALRRAHTRNVGRDGSAAAADLLAAAADGARSAAERLLVRLLRNAGIMGWQLNRSSGGYQLDVSFAVERVLIEVDGWAWHSDRDRFQADRVRQNALVNSGWRVLRFTWHDLTTRPDAVVAEVRVALARFSAAS